MSNVRPQIEEPCFVCGRNSTQRFGLYGNIMCRGCEKRSYNWASKNTRFPPCTRHGVDDQRWWFGCMSCSFRRMTELNVIQRATIDLQFGLGQRKFAGTQLNSLQQLHHIREHLNEDGQNWLQLPGPLQPEQHLFDALVGVKYVVFWQLLDLLEDRVRADPDFFGRKTSIFDYSIIQWVISLLKIAGSYDDESSIVGPNCIAVNGPFVSHGRAYIEVGNLKAIVCRLICFLNRGPPPQPLDEASHLCHFGRCGLPNHLVWESTGTNRSRIDCTRAKTNGNWTPQFCTHQPPCLLDGWRYVRLSDYYWYATH